MDTPLKKLTINDLRVGMTVEASQLSDIYGVWIVIDPNYNNNNSFKILYFYTADTKDDNRLKERVFSNKSQR